MSNDEILESLLSFFSDPGDWAYVFRFKDYCINHAELTDTGSIRYWFKKRIVIRTVNNNTYSVIRLELTPQMMWEAVRVTSDGGDLIGDPEHYTIDELFDLFRCG